MISHRHKFIFVHAGRTGGSSLERIAGVELTTDQRTRHKGNTDFPEKHQSFQYYQDQYPSEFGEYFKFAIVRNPFDRLVSAWFWRTKVVGDVSCDFPEFAQTRPEGWRYISKFSLRGRSIEDAVGQFDYIGRFEKLEEAYRHLCATLRLDCTEIPRVSSTSFGEYRRYYDRDTIELVYDWYRDDIELFGYEF